MKVRAYRGFRSPKDRKKRRFSPITFRGEEGRTPRRVLFTALGAALLLVVLIATRSEPALMNSAEVATVWDRGVLRVGVRADMPGMAMDGEGLEIELARLLAERIMRADNSWPGGQPVELVPVNAMSVAAKLSDGSIDAAVCLMPANAYSGYAYSRAYYTDTIHFLTRAGEKGTPIQNIKIGCLQSASGTSLYVPSGAVYNALAAYVEAHPDDGLAESIVAYASYEDLFRGLLAGEVAAVALDGLTLGKYRDSYAFEVSPATVGSVSYAIACLNEASAIASIADMMLSDMESDGTLASLKEKYGLN